MIRVDRPRRWPAAALKAARQAGLARIRAKLAAGRALKSTCFRGHDVVKDVLYRAQHHKCCYCEGKVPARRQAVEHYRPKTTVRRTVGASAVPGYWWLAWERSNLFFVCTTCNGEKDDYFPLAAGSVPLTAGRHAPGGERALILRPDGPDDPRDHIEFRFDARSRKWMPVARRGSPEGQSTIDFVGLAWHIDVYTDYVRNSVEPPLAHFKNALSSADPARIAHHWQRLLDLTAPPQCYSALARDAIRASVNLATLAAHGLTLP